MKSEKINIRDLKFINLPIILDIFDEALTDNSYNDIVLLIIRCFSSNKFIGKSFRRSNNVERNNLFLGELEKILKFVYGSTDAFFKKPPDLEFDEMFEAFNLMFGAENSKKYSIPRLLASSLTEAIIGLCYRIDFEFKYDTKAPSMDVNKNTNLKHSQSFKTSILSNVSSVSGYTTNASLSQIENGLNTARDSLCILVALVSLLAIFDSYTSPTDKIKDCQQTLNSSENSDPSPYNITTVKDQPPIPNKLLLNNVQDNDFLVKAGPHICRLLALTPLVMKARLIKYLSVAFNVKKLSNAVHAIQYIITRWIDKEPYNQDPKRTVNDDKLIIECVKSLEILYYANLLAGEIREFDLTKFIKVDEITNNNLYNPNPYIMENNFNSTTSYQNVYNVIRSKLYPTRETYLENLSFFNPNTCISPNDNISFSKSNDNNTVMPQKSYLYDKKEDIARIAKSTTSEYISVIWRDLACPISPRKSALEIRLTPFYNIDKALIPNNSNKFNNHNNNNNNNKFTYHNLDYDANKTGVINNAAEMWKIFESENLISSYLPHACPEPLLADREFVNDAIESVLILERDYLDFRFPKSSSGSTVTSSCGQYIMNSDKTSIYQQFSFLGHPFVLSTPTKQYGLHLDNRIRMYDERRVLFIQSLLNNSHENNINGINVQQNRNQNQNRNPLNPNENPNEIENHRQEFEAYLRFHVRRSHLIADCLANLEMIVEENPEYLRRQLLVEFEGETGHDQGGLSKEFFQLVIQQIFNPDYGMFKYVDDVCIFWFNTLTSSTTISQQGCNEQWCEYYLVGTIIGLAIYNSIILDINFPQFLYYKLYGRPASFSDLNQINPSLYNGLSKLLTMDSDEFEEFTWQSPLTFSINVTDPYGNVSEYELLPNGSHIPVTLLNRQDYVNLYADYLLNLSIATQFEAFKRGFDLVINEKSPLYRLFNPRELELLICGNPDYDFHDLEHSTAYEGGYDPNTDVIKYFWDTVHNYMSMEERKTLLKFTTGSDRVPLGGLAKLKFHISKQTGDINRLPSAHTCFNYLMLPEYESLEQLQERLFLALKHSKGFGLV